MKTVVMDNSAAGSFAQCSTMGVLRYGLGYTSVKESAPMGAGRAAHEALDLYLRKGATEEAQKHALAKYASEYLKYIKEEPEDGRLSLENTSTVMEKWFENHRAENLLFELKDAEFEQDVALPLDLSLVFMGRLDGIARSKMDGKWYVVEHKTTGMVNSFWASQWHTSSQITGYIWAASQILGETVVGCLVNAIEFSQLPSDPMRKCRTHGVTYAECRKEHAKSEWITVTRAPWQVEQWESDFRRLAWRYHEALKAVAEEGEEVKTLPMEGTFTGACRFCEFKDFCGMGRGTNLVELLLRKDPWKLSMANNG